MGYCTALAVVIGTERTVQPRYDARAYATGRSNTILSRMNPCDEFVIRSHDCVIDRAGVCSGRIGKNRFPVKYFFPDYRHLSPPPCPFDELNHGRGIRRLLHTSCTLAGYTDPLAKRATEDRSVFPCTFWSFWIYFIEG